MAGTVHTYTRQNVLIWGKTYPELSSGHRETVCTGGFLEDGSPIRLYPVPFRYIEQFKQYGLYQWIDAPIARNLSDARPESHKVEASNIRLLDTVPPGDGWRLRADIVFRKGSEWHFDCVEQLKAAQKVNKTSMGMVPVSRVDRVWAAERSPEDRAEHEVMIASRRSEIDMFGAEFRDLEFLTHRVKMNWHCIGERCPGHSASVLDWGLCELIRREGPYSGVQKIKELADPDRHDLRLFVGNIHRRPHIFTIIGLWYPLRRQVDQGSLFAPY